MTHIISISIDEQTESQIQQLQQINSFSGKSDTIRNAVHSLYTDNQEQFDKQKVVEATLQVVHTEHTKEIFTIVHKFQNTIKTHLHHHLQNHDCLDIFIIESSYEQLQTLVKKLQKIKSVKLVKHIVF